MAKLALLIGASKYEAGLPSLPAAQEDIKALQGVLQGSELSDFDDVALLVDPNRQVMEESIDALFSGREKSDLVLLYFSGHGVKDESGKLYLATCITRKNLQGELVKSTAVAASFIHDIMDNSRSRRQVVILDCCFSGAFSEGLLAKKGNNPVGVPPQLNNEIDIEAQLGGEGRAILTSSTSVQYSFEQKGMELSVYTRYLVEGIETGAADLDSNGWISVDELHQYAKKKVQGSAPAMKPEIYAVREGFRIQLLRARTDDPKLAYRKEVEQCAGRGEISTLGRRILDRQREKWGLSVDQVAAIENAVLQPYREYRRKLQEYEEAFCDVIQIGRPLPAYTREELKRLQRVLGLRDEDVLPIESRINQQSNQDQIHTRLNYVRQIASKVLYRQPRQVSPPLQTLELLGKAIFWGFEAGLLGIAIFSLLKINFTSIGIWLLITLGILLAQLRWQINGLFSLGMTIISLLLIILIPSLNSVIASSNSTFTILLVASLASLAAFIFVALCMLIYKILSSSSL